MRVLIATDRIDSFSAAEAGQLLARAWLEAAPQVEPAVVPLAVNGADLATVLSELEGERTRVVGLPPSEPVEGIPLDATSAVLGAAVEAALDAGAEQVVVDATNLVTHDGGAGFLSALGAVADVPLERGVRALRGLSQIDLSAVRERLGGVRLTLVASEQEKRSQLLGLQGITSVRRSDGDDPAHLLATDQTLADLARAVAPDAKDLPGSGACGGLGYAVLALGGEITTGSELCARAANLDATLPAADLVVIGTTAFDFGHRGGEVVQFIADRAHDALRPAVVIAGSVAISGREMRTLAVESAYGVHPTPQPVSAEGLAELVRRVARTWSW